MDIIVTRKLLFIDQHVMSEILNTNKDIMTDMGIISRNEVNKELLLKKKEVPETIKKERAQYEILGITNVLIDENLKSVSFDYNDASFDYECKGGMDTITVTKKDGTDYTFEFLNSLFVKNLEEHTSQKIETHNKNLFTRLNFCLNAQDKISKEIPEGMKLIEKENLYVRGTANKEDKVYFITEKNGEERYFLLQMGQKEKTPKIVGISGETYDNNM